MLSIHKMTLMSILFALLACSALAYNVADLDRLRLDIDGPSGSMSFDLSLNDDSRFSAEVQNLDAGKTNITLSGYNADGTEMYNGDWEGSVRSDGKPTQVALYMVDLLPDIDYATVSNLAPFFTSIQVEPSNIAHNESLNIRTRARDLDGTSLNYTFNPIDTLYGSIVPCDNGGAYSYCTTQYRSSESDTNGMKNFEIGVTDGEFQDSIVGAFNIRAYGGVDIDVIFNNRPGVSAIEVGPSSFLTSENPTLSMNVSAFDDGTAQWEWEVTGNGTECTGDRLGGDVTGSFSTQVDMKTTFTAQTFDESSCTIKLHVRDGTTAGLDYHLTVPIFVGTEQSNMAPHTVFAYSTSRKPSSGDTVMYTVRATDADSHYMTAAWSISSPGTGVINSQASHDVSTGSDTVYDFTMEMISGGHAGTVTCTVTDADGLEHNTTFHSIGADVNYQLAQAGQQCPTGTEIVTDRDECIDAVSHVGHTWDENNPNAYAAQTDGNGYCIQCIFCDSRPISYMNMYKFTDIYTRHYCKPTTSRRRLSVSAYAQAPQSPFVFGLDMRIEDGTLHLTSNEVPRKYPVNKAAAKTSGNELIQHETHSSQLTNGAIIGCAVAGVALVVAGVVAQRKRSKKQTPQTAEV